MTDITLFQQIDQTKIPMTQNIYPDILAQFTPDPTRVEDIDTKDNIKFATVGVNKVIAQPNYPVYHHKTFEPVPVRRTNGPLIIYDKRWYFRLVSKQGEYKRARALMDDFNLNEISRHMVVCFTPDRIPGNDKPFRNKDGKPIRIYGFFDSYLEFYEYMQKFPTTDRAFYEIIFGELPQKPHFDIDISLKDVETLYPNEDIDVIAETLREYVIMGCIQVLAENLVTVDISRDVLLYSSHGEDKRSYHLVLNNKCHDGNKEAKAFYDAVMVKLRSYTGGKYLDFVDRSVYSPRQQFRLVGCQKQGSNRPKVFYEQFQYQQQLYTHAYTEDVTDITFKKLTIIYESMPSFTSGCSFLPSLIPPKPVNQYNLGDMPDLEKSIVDYCLTMLHDKIKNSPFTVTNHHGQTITITPTSPYVLREVQGHMITLTRQASSYCPVCKILKPHDGEHPYMIIVGGKIYWDCRRHPDGKRLFVGYLAMTLEELQTGFAMMGHNQEDRDEDDPDEGGEFMFGNYQIGAPPLQPLKKTPDIVQAQTHTVPQITIPPEQCMQDVYGDTLRIAKEWAAKKYVRREPEDLNGVRSLTSVSSQLAWNPGL